MPVNKVICNDRTLIDLTSSTVTSADLAYGDIVYNAAGARIAGSLPVRTQDNVRFQRGVLNIPNGIYVTDVRIKISDL